MKKLIIVILFLCFNGSAQVIFNFEENIEDWCTGTPNVELTTSQKYSAIGSKSLKISSKNTDTTQISYSGKLDFSNTQFLKFNMYLPDTNLSEISFKCYVKDVEWHWFETKLFRIKGGEKKEVSINVSHTSFDWKPLNHFKGWDNYVTRDIGEFGIIFFFQKNYTGPVYIDAVELVKTRFPDGKVYLYDFEDSNDKLTTFGRFEISFKSSYIPANPFDPKEFRVVAKFVSPTGKTFEVPAFYYHNYLRYLDVDGENLEPYGTEEWKIRFSPQEAGRYFYTLGIYVNDNIISELNGGDFLVTKSKDKGFIRLDKKDPLYLSFQNGTFFYPIGHTLRSTDDLRSPYRYEFSPPKNMGTFAYDQYFKKMSDNGENYARVWMSAWWAGIEWSPFYSPHYRGLGRYSVENAWRLDYLLESANKNDIYIDLTLINHGQFSRPDAEWRDNPYNAINDGILENANEFFTDKNAIEYFQRRLDYIVSRWGYSKNIVFWELWNEIDLTINYNTQNVKNWHKIIHPYIKNIDPYKHLITTHYCRRNADPTVWAIPELEMIVGNSYDAEMVKSVLDFFVKRKPFEKPIFINEYGVGRNRQFLENNLHAGIWASSMTPMTGSALFWWWPFIDHFDLYFHYKALSNFWKGEDRRGKNFQLTPATVHSDNKDLGIIGIQNSSEGFFWIYAEKLFNDKKPQISSAERVCTVDISNFSKGNYKLEFWDTYKGTILATQNLLIKDEKEKILIPKFINDIAIKIKKK